VKTLVAVDPGASGGLAIRDREGSIILQSMPDTLPALVGLLMIYKAAGSELWIEEVPKFTGKNIPSSTTAVLFQNVGRVEGAAVALGYSLHRVPPKVWQEPLGLGGRKSVDTQAAWKRKLRGKAEELYPSLDITLATADAVLVLHFVLGGGR